MLDISHSLICRGPVLAPFKVKDCGMEVAVPRNARNYASLKESTTVSAYLREAYAGQLKPPKH
jgi:hypothetical protein